MTPEQEQQERDAFEVAMRALNWTVRLDGDEYTTTYIRGAWRGWQVRAQMAQAPQPADRRLQTAMRQWAHWKAYAIELQERLVKYEGGAPMLLNGAAQPADTETMLYGKDGPIREGWRISIGPGPEGYGVYAHTTEFPGEGAVCICTIDPRDREEWPAEAQEPVAVVRDCTWTGQQWRVQALAPTKLRSGDKLYAAPQPAPARQPLTDADIDAVKRTLRGENYDLFRLARALIAAYEAKNGITDTKGEQHG